MRKTFRLQVVRWRSKSCAASTLGVSFRFAVSLKKSGLSRIKLRFELSLTGRGYRSIARPQRSHSREILFAPVRHVPIYKSLDIQKNKVYRIPRQKKRFIFPGILVFNFAGISQ